MTEDQLDRFANDLASAVHEVGLPVVTGVPTEVARQMQTPGYRRLAERLMHAGYRRVDAGEACACGSSVWTDDTGVVADWREHHRCTIVPPGPCHHDSGVEVWITGVTMEPDLSTPGGASCSLVTPARTAAAAASVSGRTRTSACDQELCPYWDGAGCPCRVLGVSDEDRETAAAELRDWLGG